MTRSYFGNLRQDLAQTFDNPLHRKPSIQKHDIEMFHP